MFATTKTTGAVKYAFLVPLSLIFSQVHLVSLFLLVSYALTQSSVLFYALIPPIIVMAGSAARYLKFKSYYLPFIYAFVVIMSIILAVFTLGKIILGKNMG